MTKIAIVEDDRTTREGLETIINLTAAFQCVCACMTAEDALRLVPPHAPQVVLMDIQLPKMSGVECVSRLKELQPSMQIIMLTVYEDPDRIFCALRAGACGYLLKRSTPEQIIASIRDVQRGGVPMSSEIARKVIAHFREQETAAADLEGLSPREREVIDLVVRGLSNKEIVDRLGITIEGVRWHLRNIYQKLHVHTRTEVLVKFRPRLQ
jgi:DNA-binding NarL/FixJ family response regulator